MGKGLLSKLENRVYWGTVGTLLTIAFGIMGLYAYFHERKPSIQVEVVGESNVLDLHKPLENLTIYFDKEDIQKKSLNLRIINLQISNNGEIDILQSHFDQKTRWGIKISSGKIINDARIINTNSEYLRDTLSPKVLGDNVVEFEKVIFEKGKYFSIEILVLHNKDTLPEITCIGKIAGIDKIASVKTWEKRLRPSFLDTFFYGGFLINILRPIVAFIFLILLVIVIVISSEKVAEITNRSRKKKRKKEMDHLFRGKAQGEKTQFIIDSYIDTGLKGLKQIENYIKDEKKLLVEIKRFNLEQDYEAKLKALAGDKGASEGRLPEQEALLLPDSVYLPVAKHARYYWFRPYIDDFLKKKIVIINEQDEVGIDSDFRKTLLQVIHYFENKANKRLNSARE